MSLHTLPLDIQDRWNVPIACRWDIHLRDVLIRKLQTIYLFGIPQSRFCSLFVCLFFAGEQMNY